ncbi:polyketide biosynthesis acyl carrier protein [Saccharothrix tamanrassetensis]|uniref:Polyketide biosynthesis acyl carrier protein n=1 Tax=Saccharothrix tamanrassetensis TaxID=1051531 RepID=A0A841C9E5_9PSEU|nr:phosphopantetheine-binding protein [Saccharothrix tamanrassetensis]MBB5953771.1 polyketide biosynthesis acyl carrier protein [Saccharothrix tamanrassetensis]
MSEAVRDVVHEVITEILPTVPADRISGRQHLRDLGADSVDRVEIILGVRERLGLAEPLASFSDLRDIDHLVAFLTELGAR